MNGINKQCDVEVMNESIFLVSHLSFCFGDESFFFVDSLVHIPSNLFVFHTKTTKKKEHFIIATRLLILTHIVTSSPCFYRGAKNEDIDVAKLSPNLFKRCLENGRQEKSSVLLESCVTNSQSVPSHGHAGEYSRGGERRSEGAVHR